MKLRSRRYSPDERRLPVLHKALPGAGRLRNSINQLPFLYSGPENRMVFGVFMKQADCVSLDHVRPESNIFGALFVWAVRYLDGYTIS